MFDYPAISGRNYCDAASARSGVDGNSVDLCQTRSKKSTLRACPPPPTPLDRSCIHLLGPRTQDPPENAQEERRIRRRTKRKDGNRNSECQSLRWMNGWRGAGKGPKLHIIARSLTLIDAQRAGCNGRLPTWHGRERNGPFVWARRSTPGLPASGLTISTASLKLLQGCRIQCWSIFFFSWAFPTCMRFWRYPCLLPVDPSGLNRFPQCAGASESQVRSPAGQLPHQFSPR